MARSDLPVAAPGHAHWDTSAIEARIINGTTTKADVRWLVESVEALADHRDALPAERQQDKERIERLEKALRLIRDERCECGGRFKWDKDSLLCEQCGLRATVPEPRSRSIARAALAVEEDAAHG